MRTAVLLVAVLAATAAVMAPASAELLFHEEFKSIGHWVQSKHSADYGSVAHTAGKFFADAEKDKGLQLTQDARFYAVSTPLPTPVSNDNKDLVVSFSLKNEQKLKCGGGYIKLLPEMDATDFHGESKYWLMFGPDRCGPTSKVHIILNHGGKNHEWKRSAIFPNDQLTHFYTLHIAPDGSYEYYMDGESKIKGTLEEDWSIVEPKEIDDPSDTKPEDWVDESTMDDPEDKKPEDWDTEPAMIADADATKPQDWDDAEDGEWEAPMVPNPKSKGPWAPKRITNPAYKGEWAPRKMPNPDYKPIADLYKIPEPLQHVGIDVWQVESGSIFGNIVIGDNVKETLDLVKSTLTHLKTAEQDAIKAFEKAEKEAEEKKKAEKKAEKKPEEEKPDEEDDKEDL